MSKETGLRFKDELGCKIPAAFLEAFSDLDPQLVDVIRHKGKTTTNWEELALFFRLKHLNPQIAHQLATELGNNPAVPNRGKKLSTLTNKKKWNVLKKAKNHLDEATLKNLEHYLGIGLKKAVRQKVKALLALADEDEPQDVLNIDADTELWDTIYDYLAIDNELAEAFYGARTEVNLQDLTTSVPHLVKRAINHDFEDPNQFNLQL